jgi:hypothetical protein
MPRLARPAVLLALPAALAIAGCTHPAGRFPTLDRRPQEAAAAQPDRPAPAIAIDPRSPRMARIAALRTAGRDAAAAFDAARPAAEAAARRAGAAGSDSWMDAQRQLSALMALRGPAGTALAELDEIGRLLATDTSAQADAERRALSEATAAVAAADGAMAAAAQAIADRLSPG